VRLGQVACKNINNDIQAVKMTLTVNGVLTDFLKEEDS
jgi:hypothetical protein